MAIKAPTKNLYEVVVILNPKVSEDDLENNISLVETAIKNYGGSVVRIDEPLRRKFPHKVKNCKDGYYVSVLFNSPPELPNTLKRTLAIADDVLRYIVVRKESPK